MADTTGSAENETAYVIELTPAIAAAWIGLAVVLAIASAVGVGWQYLLSGHPLDTQSRDALTWTVASLAVLATTFHFVNDGIESALRQARDVAGGKDIRIAGGAHAILQYLNAGLVDEFSIALSPVLLGAGLRLFDGVDQRRISLDIVEAIHSPMVTHLSYAVRRR